MSTFKTVINFLNGFRKFTIMASLVAIGIVFRVTDHLSGQEFVELLRYTTIAFFSANGIEHMTKAVSEWIKGRVKSELVEK